MRRKTLKPYEKAFFEDIAKLNIKKAANHRWPTLLIFLLRCIRAKCQDGTSEGCEKRILMVCR